MTFRKILLLKVFLIFALEKSFATAQSAKKVIVHGYGQCTRNLKDLAVVINNGVLSYKLQNFNIHGNLTVKEDLPKDFYIHILETKCPVKTGVCAYYHNESMTYICPLLNIASQRVKPSLKCPVKKGVYEVRNLNIPISALLLMPIENNRWKIELNLMAKKTKKAKPRELGCVYLDATVLPTKLQ